MQTDPTALNAQDYENLLNILQQVPTTGTNNMRGILQLEAKLMRAANALLQPPPDGDDGNDDEGTNDGDKDGG